MKTTAKIVCAKAPRRYPTVAAITYGGGVWYCSFCGARVRVVA